MPHARKFCAALIAADAEKAKEWAKAGNTPAAE